METCGGIEEEAFGGETVFQKDQLAQLAPLTQPPMLLTVEDSTRGEDGDEPKENDNSRDEEVEEVRREDEPPPPLNQPLTATRKLEAVYGEKMHHDERTHLDGGVKEDGTWQSYWRPVVALPPQRYNIPSGRVGQLFITALAAEIKGVKDHRWNSERFLIFQAVIFQRMSDVKRARDIRWMIKNRLVERGLNHFTMLVQDTVRASSSLISTKRRGMSNKKAAKTFKTLVLKGKIRLAIRFVTMRDKDGVLAPGATDEKSGKTVLEVLKGNHSEAVIPEVEALWAQWGFSSGYCVSARKVRRLGKRWRA